MEHLHWLPTTQASEAAALQSSRKADTLPNADDDAAKGSAADLADTVFPAQTLFAAKMLCLEFFTDFARYENARSR